MKIFPVMPPHGGRPLWLWMSAFGVSLASATLLVFTRAFVSRALPGERARPSRKTGASFPVSQRPPDTDEPALFI